MIGTTSTAAKASLAKEHGVEHVILYDSDTHLIDEVLKLTKGVGVQAVFDGVGADTYLRSLALFQLDTEE